MNSKVLDHYIDKGLIRHYDDHSRSNGGYRIYLPKGKQWADGEGHQQRLFTTLPEAITGIRQHIVSYPDDPQLNSIKQPLISSP